MRYGMGFILLITLAVGRPAVGSTEPVALIVGGQKIFLHTPPVLMDGAVYVPLAALNAVGAKSETDKKQKRDGQKVEITSCDGRKFSCRARLIDGELMLPASDICPGLDAVPDWDEAAKTLSIRARVKKVEFDGSELRVVTSYPVTYEIAWWKAANKLILDMYGVHLPVKQSDLPIENTTPVSIRTGVQKDGETGRVVLDMPNAVKYRGVSGPKTSKIVVVISGFRLAPEPSNLAPSGRTAESEQEARPAEGTPAGTAEPPKPELPPVSITDVDYRKLSSRRIEVYIVASGPVKYVTSLSRQPDQLSVDIANAILARAFDDMPVGHGILQGIRVGQVGEKRVRVTMDLTRVAGFDDRQDEAPNRLVITLEMPKGAGGLLSDKIVVIDPGHGGSDTGARGCDGALEKHLNLTVAARVQKLLKDAGATALMTRTSDTALGLADRADYARRHSADLFVSIHHNASNPARSGTETYYHGREMSSRALAYCVHSEVVKVVGLPDRSVKSDFAMYKTGFGVLRRATESGIPAVLLEVGFINHPVDWVKIKDSELQGHVAEAVVRGLKSYIEGNHQPIRRTDKAEPQVDEDSEKPASKPKVDTPRETEAKPGAESSSAPQQVDTPKPQPEKPASTTGPRRPGERLR